MKALLLLLLIIVVASAGNLNNETNVSPPYSHESDGDLEDIEEQQLLDLDDVTGLEQRELQRGCFRDGERCMYDSHCCGGECVWTRTTRYIRGGRSSYGICLGGGGGVNNNYNNNYGAYNYGRCSRDSHCPRGFYCNWRRGICQRGGGGVNNYNDYYYYNNFGVYNNARCSRDSHCPRGYYCNWRRRICERGGGGFNTYGTGSFCLRTSDCLPGMHCRSNFCTW
jgi:hypothetical protein